MTSLCFFAGVTSYFAPGGGQTIKNYMVALFEGTTVTFKRSQRVSIASIYMVEVEPEKLS